MKAKFLVTLVLSFFFSMILGSVVGSATGFSPLAIGAGAFTLSFIPNQVPTGSLGAGVLVEVWTGELIKKLREMPTFMAKIPARNNLVNNNVIHMVDVGADPGVLINNTTYPIAVASRTDSDVAISLHKFETENTSITDDELYSISYDKIGSVIKVHKEVLSEGEADKALHSLAPSTNSASTPVLETTGASNGETQARKRMTMADLRKMKKQFDDLKVPKIKGARVAVLCNEHIADLLETEEKFAQQYNIDTSNGKIPYIYGFEIHEYTTAPVYSVVSTVLTKKAFGAAADAANDQVASVFFYANRTFQATGETKMYYSKAESDPTMRRSVVGFRQWHIVLPKKWLGFGAIVAAKVS